MFDIGFAELIIISIVALLVIGPERLPGAVRTASAWLRRLRRSYNEIRHEIERELHNDAIVEELRETRREMEGGLKETRDTLSDDLRETREEFERDVSATRRALEEDTADTAQPPAKPPAPALQDSDTGGEQRPEKDRDGDTGKH